MTDEPFELPEALDFDACCELFQDLKTPVSPAELHGQLTGYLSAGAEFTAEQWLKLAGDSLSLEQLPGGNLAEELLEFYQVTLAFLSHDSFSFMPLLADEDSPVEERLQCLADWCAGFLAGFALSGRADDKKFSPEVEESLKDLAEISQVGLADDDDIEQLDENAWFEIIEYVRMLAMNLFYESANKHQAVASAKANLH